LRTPSEKVNHIREEPLIPGDQQADSLSGVLVVDSCTAVRRFVNIPVLDRFRKSPFIFHKSFALRTCTYTYIPPYIMKLAVLVILSVLASANAACGPSGFKASGSNLLSPVALAWVPGYQKQCPKATPITITEGGSSVGVADVCAGKVDAAMMSRSFKSTEATAGANGVFTCVTSKKTVTQFSVALDGVVLIAKKGGNADKCFSILVSPAQTAVMQAASRPYCWGLYEQP
jgi:PBP superfamily domain